MSQVLTTFSPVTWALVHGDKWPELMCFVQSAKSILLLWASTGDPVALGLENEATRKRRCRLLCDWAVLSPLLRGPIWAPCLFLGSFPWAGRADSAPASPGSANGGLMHGLVPVLHAQSPADHHPLAHLLEDLPPHALGNPSYSVEAL